MRFVIALGLALLLNSPAGADTGMSTFNYYVGRWSCLAGPPHGQTRHVRVTFAFDGTPILRTTVAVAAAPGRPAFAESELTAWDGKTWQYVQVALDQGAGWSVDRATPPLAIHEVWLDIAVSEGSRGREELRRVDRNHYVVENFATAQAGVATSASRCTRDRRRLSR